MTDKTDAPTPAEIEAFFSAIKSGDMEAVKAALKRHPTLAAGRDPAGITALMTAIYFRQPVAAAEIRVRLITISLHEAAAMGEADHALDLVKADPGQLQEFSPDGFQPLHLAAFFGHEDLALEFLRLGAPADVAADNTMAVRPLHCAAAASQEKLAKALLEAGADADARQQGGVTPLMSAASRGNRGIAEILLAAGADKAATSDEGKAPADYARERGVKDLVPLLS